MSMVVSGRVMIMRISSEVDSNLKNKHATEKERGTKEQIFALEDIVEKVLE